MASIQIILGLLAMCVYVPKNTHLYIHNVSLLSWTWLVDKELYAVFGNNQTSIKIQCKSFHLFRLQVTNLYIRAFICKTLEISSRVVVCKNLENKLRV